MPIVAGAVCCSLAGVAWVVGSLTPTRGPRRLMHGTSLFMLGAGTVFVSLGVFDVMGL